MNKTVRFNLVIGAIALAGSLFILFSSLYTGFSINTITGVILGIIGIAWLSSKKASYDENEIRINNLFGATIETYNLKEKQLTRKGDALYIDGKKINLTSLNVHSGDLKAMLDFYFPE
jgi:hypothetical protein